MKMNIWRFIGIVGIIMLLSACSGEENTQDKVPNVLIPEDKMAEILSEVQLIEAYLNEIPYNKRGKSDSDYVYYPILFEKYEISKEVFLDNMDYYSQNTSVISSIYDESIILLNKLKAKDLEIRLEMKFDSIRQDSIRNALSKARLDSLREVVQEKK